MKEMSIEAVNAELKLVMWDDEPTLEMPFTRAEREWFARRIKYEERED